MEKKKKSIFKRWWFWVLIVLVIGIGAGSCGGDSKESENQKAVADDTEADQPAGKAKEESDTGAKETGKSDEATVDEQTLMDQNHDHLGWFTITIISFVSSIVNISILSFYNNLNGELRCHDNTNSLL